MQKEFMFECKRKSVHVLFGGVLALLAWFVPVEYFRIILSASLTLGIFLSFMARTRTIPLISTALKKLERKKEQAIFPGKGPIMLVAGVLFTSFFVNNLVLISGLAVIIIGDTIGHLGGMRFGKIHVPWDRTKHIEGRIVGILVTWLVLVLWWESLFISVAYGVLFLGVLGGMLVESLPLRKIGLDDNLLVPLVTALIIYFLTPALI